MIDIATAWRPFELHNGTAGVLVPDAKRFFHVDDGGDSFTIVARDVAHAKRILLDHGVHFTKEDGYSAPIDHPQFDELEWREMSPSWVARTRVHLDDNPNSKSVPLDECQLGDFFSSEW